MASDREATKTSSGKGAATAASGKGTATAASDEAATKKTELLVIGAGLPRTGTLSLMTALETILPGKCLHGFKQNDHEEEWCAVMNGTMSDDDLRVFLTSYDIVAGLDLPFLLVYKRALKLFPKAKVVLSVRDVEGWVRSMKRTIFEFDTHWFEPLRFLNRFFPVYLTEYGCDDALQSWSSKLAALAWEKNYILKEMYSSVQGGNGVEFFNKWIADVEATVPKERLLKFDVKEGWGPLCQHLDVTPPDIPFPKKNTSMEFGWHMRKNKRRSWLLLYELISIPLLSFWLYTKF